MVAGPERQKYGGRRRHPGCKGETGCPALEPGKQRFRLNECWVCRPAVGIAGPILVVGIADESGGGMHRKNERLGLLVDPSERLRGHCRRVARLQGLLLLVLARDHRSLVLKLIR